MFLDEMAGRSLSQSVSSLSLTRCATAPYSAFTAAALRLLLLSRCPSGFKACHSFSTRFFLYPNCSVSLLRRLLQQRNRVSPKAQRGPALPSDASRKPGLSPPSLEPTDSVSCSPEKELNPPPVPRMVLPPSTRGPRGWRPSRRPPHRFSRVFRSCPVIPAWLDLPAYIRPPRKKRPEIKGFYPP